MPQPKKQEPPKPSKQAVRGELAKTGYTFSEAMTLTSDAKPGGMMDAPDPNLVPGTLFPPVTQAAALAAQAATQAMLAANVYPLNNGFNFGT